MKHALILLFLALTAYAQMQERVAIINTLDDYDSISVSALTYLTDRLRETAVNVLPAERFGVMTTESIVAFLGSMENTIRVCKESSCLAELGRKVSADYVAQGRIGRFGRDLTIKVELYSVVSGNLIGSFTGDSKDIYGLRDIINEKATDLFKKMLASTPPPKPVAPTPPPPKEIQPEEPEPTLAEKNKEDEYDYTYLVIQRLIDEGLEKNEEEIQEKSFHIHPVDRAVLYKETRRTAASFLAFLNVLPGFGLGSYIQGDITFGIIQSATDVVGLGVINVLRDQIMEGASCPSDKYPTCKEMEEKESDIAFYGLCILIVSRIVGVIVPFVYQYKYNKILREALNIDESISFSIDPLIVPRDGTPALGLAFNVRY